ncbi:glycosyltransferase family 1 protein [Bacillus megaterium]|nr:glycosyltransferase family 1 protein [Priestia megaterium]
MAKGVIVTSKTLYVHKSKKNLNCILVPNAVNPEVFMESYDKPQDIISIKKPIVGYMGAIANWFDQDLTVEVANQNKDKAFLLVGTVYTNVDKLKAVDNIYLLGTKEYNQVPAYVNHFNVGIIPLKWKI